MNLKKMFKISLQMLIPCLFFGWTLIAIAAGSIYPPINNIAKPFVCPNGDMKFEQQGYRPSPGTTVTTTTWVCTNPRSGTEKVIDVMALTIPAGIIDGLIIFFPIMAVVALVQLRRGGYSNRPVSPPVRQDLPERMDFLKQQYLESQGGGAPVERSDGPLDFQEILSTAEAAREKAGKLRGATEELTHLKQLLNQGLITQQDYDQKKAEILKRL